MLQNNLKCLTQEDIHSLFHKSKFESISNNIYEVKDIQIVHKRRVSKRLYFFDARFYLNPSENCKTCQKISFILKYPELEIDVIHNIQKNIKLGDKVKITCWVENMTQMEENELNETSNTTNNVFLFHIKKVDITEKYNSNIAFVPELPVIEKKNKPNLNSANNDIQNNENKKQYNCNNNNNNKLKYKISNQSNNLEKKGICKFWLNSKNCIRGKDCPFHHITNEELKKQWIVEVSYKFRNIKKNIYKIK